jgi:hypothetical protein
LLHAENWPSGAPSLVLADEERRELQQCDDPEPAAEPPGAALIRAASTW